MTDATKELVRKAVALQEDARNLRGAANATQDAAIKLEQELAGVLALLAPTAPEADRMSPFYEVDGRTYSVSRWGIQEIVIQR